MLSVGGWTCGFGGLACFGDANASTNSANWLTAHGSDRLFVQSRESTSFSVWTRSTSWGTVFGPREGSYCLCYLHPYSVGLELSIAEKRGAWSKWASCFIPSNRLVACWFRPPRCSPIDEATHTGHTDTAGFPVPLGLQIFAKWCREEDGNIGNCEMRRKSKRFVLNATCYDYTK